MLSISRDVEIRIVMIVKSELNHRSLLQMMNSIRKNELHSLNLRRFDRCCKRTTTRRTIIISTYHRFKNRKFFAIKSTHLLHWSQDRTKIVNRRTKHRRTRQKRSLESIHLWRKTRSRLLSLLLHSLTHRRLRILCRSQRRLHLRSSTSSSNDIIWSFFRIKWLMSQWCTCFQTWDSHIQHTRRAKRE